MRWREDVLTDDTASFALNSKQKAAVMANIGSLGKGLL